MNALESTKARIADTARGMLSGEVGLIEGARQLIPLITRLHERDDELFVPIVALESETEDVPLGDTRLLWSEESLKKREAAVAPYLRSVRGEILEVCEELVRRYSKKTV